MERERVMITQQHSHAPVALSIGGRAPVSGIMVLALNREVLYLNKAGRDLLQQRNQTVQGSPGDGLPKAFADLVDEVLASRLRPAVDRGWRRFPEKRLVQAPDQFLFVQAFAQSHEPHLARPFIVLTMHVGDNQA